MSYDESFPLDVVFAEEVQALAQMPLAPLLGNQRQRFMAAPIRYSNISDVWLHSEQEHKTPEFAYLLIHAVNSYPHASWWLEYGDMAATQIRTRVATYR